MKFLKYPLIVLALFSIVAVIFWDDIKLLFNKAKKQISMTVFKSNINNPFNIKANAANKWNGKTTKPGDTFESFDKIENGIRAGIKILKKYFESYHLNTVQKIVNRFAPNTENDTENYIQFVCSSMGVDRDEILSEDKETLFELSAALCKMENGYELKREDYEAAWKLV